MEPAPASAALQPASKWLRLLAHGIDLALSLALARAIGVLVGYQPEVGSLSSMAVFLIPPAVIAALAVPALYPARGLGLGATFRAPAGAVMTRPVDQGALETDVPAGLFRLDPLVAKDLFPLGPELGVERGACRQFGILMVSLIDLAHPVAYR